MPNYRRAFTPGGTFFFTLVTEDRRPLLTDPVARRVLREAIATRAKAQPFELTAIVLLPDHLHAMWQLPDGDADFSARWSRIKSDFTAAGSPPPAAKRALARPAAPTVAAASGNAASGNTASRTQTISIVTSITSTTTR